MRFWALSAAAALAGCTGSAPPKDITAPDVSKISLFFPVDNLVHGRGEAGAFEDAAVSHVYIASQPLGTDATIPVAEDGSFNFSILGQSRDIIEIAGLPSDSGEGRGESVFFRVPLLPTQRSRFVCCAATGTCAREEDVEAGIECPARDQPTAQECVTIRECGKLNREILPIAQDRITVSPPNAEGRVVVRGSVQTPGALVRLENRGLRAIGLHDPGLRRSVIADPGGSFRFDDVLARGDDELVIQLIDLLGNRSPESPLMVPDAPLTNLDFIGAYAFEDLESAKPGTVAVRLHPSGVDGRGICPNSSGSPTLCFSGGLTHEMVEMSDVRIGGQPVELRPASTSETRPLSRATEGDPLRARQRVVLVVDLSTEAEKATNTAPRRFEVARSFIGSLREADEIAIVSFGAAITTDLQLTGGQAGRALALQILETLPAKAGMGKSTVLEAIAQGANLLEGSSGGSGAGTIVVLALSDPDGDEIAAGVAFDKAYDAVRGLDGTRRHIVHVVGAELAEREANPTVPGLDRATDINLLRSIAQFTGGRFINGRGPREFAEGFQRVAGVTAGVYVLLYDFDVPPLMAAPGSTQTDVDVELSMKATVTLDNATGGRSTASDQYNGVIPVRVTLP